MANVEKLVESILNGADIQQVISNNESVDAKAVEKAINKLKPGFTQPNVVSALKSSGIKDKELIDGIVDMIADYEEDGVISGSLEDGDKGTIKDIAKSIVSSYVEAVKESEGEDDEDEDEDEEDDDDDDDDDEDDDDEEDDEEIKEGNMNESTDTQAILKAIKKLKPQFTEPQLRSALKSAVKDKSKLEALIEYFTEIEEEDAIVSMFLSKDISEKEMKAAIESFVKDVLNECECGYIPDEEDDIKECTCEDDEDEDEDSVNESGESSKIVSSLTKGIKSLKAGKFTGPDLEKLVKKALVAPEDQEDMYEFLADLEEEESVLSSFISGEISPADFQDIIQSYYEA